MQELKDKVSYAVGLSIAESLKSQQLGSLDLNFLKNGIQDVFEQKELKINPQEANGLIQAFLEEANTAAFGENKEQGIAFLEENKKKEGILSTDSGLQYHTGDHYKLVKYTINTETSSEKAGKCSREGIRHPESEREVPGPQNDTEFHSL